MLARLLSLLSGDKRDYAPISPISFESKLSLMLARLLRLLSGDKRDYAPAAPI
jgi:hypothetical protein